MTRLPLAARARARQQQAARDESGFVLIYVLMVITIVTVLVGSVLVVSASSVIPSVRSAYDDAADAAAQAGIQDVAAIANANCTGAYTTPAACNSHAAWPTGWTAIAQPTAGYTTEYKLDSPSPQVTAGGYLRVTSIGQVVRGGVTATRTLVADLAGGTSTSCFDYSACTQYETQAPDVMSQLYPANRSISLDSTAVSKADAVPGVSGAQTVTWNGANTSGTAGSVNSCNTPYYTGVSATSREVNPPANAPTPFVDWTETGTIGTSSVTQYQPCQVSLGSSTKLLAPSTTANGAGGYATNDAPLISNSNPGNTTGPLLAQQIYTTYSGATDPTGIAGQNYRSFTLPGYNPQVGGTPGSLSPQNARTVPGPITATPSFTNVTGKPCIYQGPTRVVLNADGTATITSPQTIVSLGGSPSSCYPLAFSTGIYFYTTPTLTSISGFNGGISVLNNGSAPYATTTTAPHTSSGWATTGQKAYTTTSGVTAPTPASAANTVIFDSSLAATSGDTTGASAPDSCSPTSTYIGTNASSACQWSEASSSSQGSSWVSDGVGWTKYSAGTTCGNDSTDRLTFECDYNRGAVNSTQDEYSNARNSIKTALAQPLISCGGQKFAPLTATAAQLGCMLQSNVGVADTAANTPNNPSAKPGDHQYIATVAPVTGAATNPVLCSSCTKTVGSAPSLTNPHDTLFDTSQLSGTASKETASTAATTFTIGRQIYGCYVPNNPSISTLLQDALNLLGLAAPPGSYDPTGKLCGQLSGLSGPGTNAWGDGGYTVATSIGGSVPQFQVTITQGTYSNFLQGKPAVINFPSMSDVTQYATSSGGAAGSNGPGDLYVEGTATTSLALVAANDVVITSGLNPANSTSTGIEVIGQNNVRVYHPVSCLSTASQTAIAATTAGFCPNDLTGLYSSIPTPVGPVGYRPYQQYMNMATNNIGTGLSINAAIFTEGGVTPSALCPTWSGAGICGGEFTVDNYNRGASLSALSVTGTVFQEHHGALGEEWEVPDASGQVRPQSGYALTLQYQNLKTQLNSFSTLIPTSTTVASLWHVVSTSTGR